MSGLQATFDTARHPRNEDGRFVSQRGRQAIIRALPAIRGHSGPSMNPPVLREASPGPMHRSPTRGESWQRIGNKIAALPIDYTGNRERERPVGSYLHITLNNQIPKSVPVEDHQAKVKRFIAMANENRKPIIEAATKVRAGKKHVYLKAHEPAARGVARWRMKPDKFPEGTPPETLHRAYNHAALLAMHDHGLVDYDFKMDDALKAELKPTEPFIRYARTQINAKAREALPGTRQEQMQHFGQSWTDQHGRPRRRMRPNQQLIKAAPFGLQKSFDEQEHRRKKNGEFAGGLVVAGGIAGAIGGHELGRFAHKRLNPSKETDIAAGLSESEDLHQQSEIHRKLFWEHASKAERFRNKALGNRMAEGLFGEKGPNRPSLKFTETALYHQDRAKFHEGMADSLSDQGDKVASHFRGLRSSFRMIGRRYRGLGAFAGLLAGGVASYAALKAKDGSRTSRQLIKAAPIGAFARRVAGRAAFALDSVAESSTSQHEAADAAATTISRAKRFFGPKQPGGVNRAGYTLGRGTAAGIKRFARNPIRAVKAGVVEGARGGSGFAQGVSDGFGGSARTRRIAGRVGAVTGALKVPVIAGAIAAKPVSMAYNELGGGNSKNKAGA